MEITKGQEFSLEIDDMGTDGEGIVTSMKNTS